MNTNYSTLISTTLRNRSSKVIDVISTNNALLHYVKQAGNLVVKRGGRLFNHPLLYKVNSSFAVRSKLGTIPLPVTDPITEASYPIRIVSGSVVLPNLDLAMNAGDKEKLMDYAKAKEMEAAASLGEVLGDQLFGAGGGANDLDGLQKLIHEDPSTQTDVGGIDPSDSANSSWRNYSHDTAVTAFNTAQAGWNAIDTSINEATFGMAGPRLMVTTKAIFTLFQLGLTTNVRHTHVGEEGRTGFPKLNYAGIPVVFDDNCPAGNFYGINTQAIRLQVLSQGNFRQTEFQFHVNQLVESALIYVYLNLTAGDRRTSFVIDSITG